MAKASSALLWLLVGTLVILLLDALQSRNKGERYIPLAGKDLNGILILLLSSFIAIGYIDFDRSRR